MIRRWQLTLSGAIWGLATAISLLPLWTRPAPPDQLPGFASASGIDARASYLFMAGIVFLTILFPMVLKPVISRLSDPGTRDWAANMAVVAMLVPLWLVLISPDPVWVLLPTMLVVMTCVTLRRFQAGFTRRDIILLPTLATVFLALIDCTSLSVDGQLITAAILVFASRLLTAAIPHPRPLSPSLCFTLAPLGIVSQSHFFSYDQRHMAWPPMVIALLSPLVLRAAVPGQRTLPARMRAFTVRFVYPVAAICYLSAISLLAGWGKSGISLFEAGNHLVPASEVLRGERLYRDIVPIHGLIHDGLLDVLLAKTSELTAGRSMKVRSMMLMCNGAAVYALGLALTGSPEAGILGFFLAASMGSATATVRVLPSLLALAIIVFAVRKGSPTPFAAAAAMVVLSGLMSAEYGVYGLAVLAFATTRVRRSWRYAVAGFLGAAGLGSLAMAIAGIFQDFLKSSFTEIATLGPVYVLGPFAAPAILQSQFRFFPEVLAGLFDHDAALFVIWVGVLLFVAGALSMPAPSGARNARLNALLTAAVWTVVLGVSYAERHHLYFQPVVAPVLIAGVFHIRKRAKWIVPAALLLLLMVAHATIHIAIDAATRHLHGPADPNLVELTDPPRARGVFWLRREAAWIQSTGTYLKRLRADDTFFDFTNRGLLYFLFNRDCPIRQVDVASYETPERQRAVIEAIDRNPHVRAAIVSREDAEPTAIDHIQSRLRAPLVWAYLQQHFTPDFEEGEVVIWRRK